MPAKGDKTAASPLHCQELIDFVADCLAFQKRKSVIKAELEAACSQAGIDAEVNYRIVEALIQLARQQMVARARESLGVHRCDHVAVLQACIADPKASWRDKIEATKLLTGITGSTALDAREEKKLAATQASGPGLSNMTPEAAEKLRQSLEQMDGAVT